jgi:hypothetical protein
MLVAIRSEHDMVPNIRTYVKLVFRNIKYWTVEMVKKLFSKIQQLIPFSDFPESLNQPLLPKS